MPQHSVIAELNAEHDAIVNGFHMFTEHTESLCAEHDELDRLLEDTGQGQLTLIPTTLTLLTTTSIERRTVFSPQPWHFWMTINGTESTDQP